MIRFVNRTTGEEANPHDYLTAPWVQASDILGAVEEFALSGDGGIVLLGRCGEFAYVPEGLIRAEFVPDWISVEERLPEDPPDGGWPWVWARCILAGRNAPHTTCAGYDSVTGEWFDESGTVICGTVTHWMPLPSTDVV